MAGATLSELADLLLSTGSAYITSPDKLINDARLRAPALARWMNGKDMTDMLSGGPDIKFNAMYDAQTTAVNALAGDDLSFSNPQVLKTGTYDWRFTHDHETYIDQDLILNGHGSSDLSTMGRYQVYTDMRMKQEARCATSMYGFMSSKLWAEPNVTTMVGKSTTAAIEQNSLAVFFNEYRYGLYNSEGSAGTAFTTVGNIDPATVVNWRHPRVTYTSGSTAQPKGSGATAGAAQNDVIAAFGRMYRKLNYVPYHKYDEYMTQNPMDRSFIACSEKGMTHFEESCRDRQDAFMKMNDPAFGEVNYRGIPLVYQQELDTATLYPNHLTLASATDNVAEGVANSTSNAWGPRYYWLTPRWVTPIFHKERFFHKHDMLHMSTTAERKVIQRTSYWNLACTSRIRNGLVSPGAASLFTAYDLS